MGFSVSFRAPKWGLFFFWRCVMAYGRKRSKMPRRKSRRDFTKKSGTHRRNVRGNPMRGGIRL